MGENIRNLRQLKEVASKYRQELIHRANVQTKDSATSTIAIFEDNLINGSEKVIEKFAVYHDNPNAMFKKLKAFTIFNECGVTELSNSQDGGLESEIVSEIDLESAQNNTQTKTNVNVDKENLATQKFSQDLQAESDSLEARSTLGCVDFIAEDYGIVASGSILDVMLVEKFLVDQDQPVKQVMIETFILEVNSNWKNELESKISGSRDASNSSNGLYSFASGLLNLASATTGGGMVADVRLGGRRNISMLVNLIESNELGRKISNPVILVKDGEQGIVDKTRTFRTQRSTTVVNASNSTTSNNEIDSYDAPLKLTITPHINKHNDVIDLDFNFVEENYDSATPTSASTSNKISTKLKIEPGEVVMMAGLFQQTQSVKSSGLPFISKLGLSNILSSLLGIFGGGEIDNSDKGTELLVFINPTVITKENIGKTITRARY